MASLKRVTHKSGRVVYRIIICLGYDGQGKKLVKNLTYSVKQSASPRQQEREARKYAMEMEDRIKYGCGAEVETISFADFAGKWLESVKGEVACGTYVGYEQLLRSRILPYFRTYKLAHIKASDIEAFYATLTKVYSIGTIRRCANVLSCIFGTARRWDMLESNPCREARKPRKKQEMGKLRYFTPQQSLMFLKSLNLPYYIGSCPQNPEDPTPESTDQGRKACHVPLQYKVFYTLSIFCGFRKGETLALRWEDIDFERMEISISKAIGRTEEGFGCKEPKNPSSVRKVPFPESMLPLLEEYRREYEQKMIDLCSQWDGQGYLFIRPDGERMGHTTAYQYFIRHLARYNQWVRDDPARAEKEGLEELPDIPLHGLRHSCATLLNYLEVNIVDISRYLGHASCSTTMNIYAHSFERQKRVASSKLNEFIKKNT